MKGMEWQTILGIILLVVLAVLLVAIIIPISGTGEGTTVDMNFRLYCSLWAGKGYKGTIVEREGKPAIDMNEPCTRALKLDCPTHPECMTTDDWPKCIAACRVASPES